MLSKPKPKRKGIPWSQSLSFEIHSKVLQQVEKHGQFHVSLSTHDTNCRRKSLPWSHIVLIAISLNKTISKQLLCFSANVNEKYFNFRLLHFFSAITENTFKMAFSLTCLKVEMLTILGLFHNINKVLQCTTVREIRKSCHLLFLITHHNL